MITRALVDFIRKERSLGTDKDAIVAMLREKGWSASDIGGAFATLLDLPKDEVPTPRVGVWAEFSDTLCLMWSVYQTRWQRFLGVGFVYLVVVFSFALAFTMFSLPALPTFLMYVALGDERAAFFVMLPYLLLGICTYILVQVWYLGTLYATAMKKGDSVLERSLAGIRRIPGILGIKAVVALLLMISFAPVIATTVLTQNPIVFVVFGPFFIMGAIALGFLLSLSLPGYFHGVSWYETALRSINIVSKHARTLLAFYVLFGLTILLVAMLVGHSGPIAIIVGLGLIAPMKVLFMIALYRRVEGEEENLESLPIPVSVSIETPKAPKKPRKVTKNNTLSEATSA